MKLTLKIDIHEYWHAGSGRGEGAGADALVVRTAGGLPYLPGRTVKGLLRDATLMAEAAGRLPQGRTAELFGQRVGDSEASQGAGRFLGRPGLLRVSDGRLGHGDQEQKAWEGLGRSKPHLLAGLTATLSSTKIDERGQAENKTLRTVEVAVPVTMCCEVTDGGEGGAWPEDLSVALPLVRSLGSKRTRGLGRCTVSVMDQGGGR